jgi:hypothetical protein
LFSRRAAAHWLSARAAAFAIEQARHLRRRQQRVVFGLERSELLAAHFRTAARHHDGGIPAQQRERATKGMQASPFLF